MDPNFQEISHPEQGETNTSSVLEDNSEGQRGNFFAQWFDILTRIGLGETMLRIGTNVTTMLAVLVVVWLMRMFFSSVPLPETALAGQADLPTPEPRIEVASVPLLEADFVGLSRQASIHTIIPNRPRLEVIQYTVVQGDTVIGIAEKFGLQPQTILWGNYVFLFDDPHSLKTGQKLNILPTDGVYHEWQAGDGLGPVAKFFGVKPEDIINYPPNKLDAASVGDFSNPSIKPGTMLIIPGGKREFYSWSAPVGITRENPAIARQMGPGSCGKVLDGAVGYGNFIWPSAKHYLSGFGYSPETNHRGIDIAGNEGEALWAADAGVIVYAGWNDYGYGNMVVVDHGNGWQSLYAHMSALNVLCGQSVGQGTIIGAIGSTGRSSGPHIHFELMHTQYGKVNPNLYLPPP